MASGNFCVRLWNLLTGRVSGPEVVGPSVAADGTTDAYAEHQRASMTGEFSGSKRAVAFYTLDAKLRQYASEELGPAIRKAGGQFLFNPKSKKALHCGILLMDGTRASDARLHATYDKVIRQKKAMQKTKDTLAVIASAGDTGRYPRGTYPGLLFFCYDPEDPQKRDPDIPVTGQPTPGGPIVQNFADIVEVLTAKIT